MGPAFIAVVRMQTVIYMTTEGVGPMKPWANANENAVIEAFRAVVTGGSAGIRRDVIVTVRTIGGYSDSDANLSIRFWKDSCEGEAGKSG
jgi:hypothetical protein